ncbi:MAG: L-histidine N(alpha)-methyltransferase, partial [Actinomycetota bacterium]
LDLCGDGAYRNFVRSKSLVARSAAELAGLIPPGAAVISLGCGQGDKDLLLLQALAACDKSPRYVPVDSSQALLEMACRSALDAGMDVRGVKGDFTDPAHLEWAVSGSPGPKVAVMLGNTLGCLDPIASCPRFANLLGPDDLLLLDGEIHGPETFAGYDNPINRRFAWAPLNSVGITEADGELVFEQRPDPRTDGLYMITKHFRASRPFTAAISGQFLEFGAGDTVEMNHSYKYSPEALERLLIRAGLEVSWRAAADDGRFAMVLAGRGR